MSKTRLVLVGGFLGAGKTTLLMRAAEHLSRQGYRVGVVTNDQGQQLVDTALLSAHEWMVEEVSGGCFCCRFPDLLTSLRRLQTEVHPDIILAEPVGSCTDLMATVLRPIRKYYADDYDVAPLTVLLDPLREVAHFESTVTYLYRQQLLEADLIALNKSDLVEPAARRSMVDTLEQAYADARVLSLSARTGEGVDGWLEAVVSSASPMQRALDIDYTTYAEAEASLGWLNTRLSLAGEPSLSPRLWATTLLESLGQRFSENQMAVAHLKLHLDAGGAALKASLTQTGEPILWDEDGQAAQAEQAAVILNARVSATPEQLQATVQQAIADTSARLQTAFAYDHFECFSPLPPQPTFRFV